MIPLYHKIIHPPLWVYLVISLSIMSAMWVYHYYDELSSTLLYPYPKSSITKINSGLPNTKWEIVAFSDIIRSRTVDIIYKQKDSNVFSIFHYSKEAKQYYMLQNFSLPDVHIKSVQPIDFEMSGYNDLLITHSQNSQPPYRLSIIKNQKGYLNSTMQDLGITTSSVPFIFDFNQSGSFDILYTNPETLKLQLLFNKKMNFQSLNHSSFFYSIAAAQLISQNAIDIIAITEKTSEKSKISVFSYFSDQNLWKVVHEFDAPPNIGQLSVGDFDGDGYLDIVFTVHPKQQQYQRMATIENEKNDTNSKSDKMSTIEKITNFLKSTDSTPTISKATLKTGEKRLIDMSYLCFMFNGPNGFHSDPKCSSKTTSMQFVVDNILPNSQPQVADLTLSGNPDILISISDSEGNKQMQLILNQPCKNCLSREMMLVSHSAFQGIGSFFDIFNSGKLDIVTDEGSFHSTLADDSYFLKVSALNGLCLDNCRKKRKNDKRYPNPAPLSTIYNGATMKITYTDKQGVKHNAIGTQRSTNGLSLPYYTFGLGENVHYVENLTVLTDFSDQWTWILPSSSVFTSTNHQFRVFLMYEIHGFYVVFGFVSLLLTLGMFVLIFSRKEDKEDKKEAEQILPLF